MKQQMYMAGNREIRVALSDEERFPCIEDKRFLNQLRQDVVAPKYNFQSGDRLQSHHLEWLKDYKRLCNNRVPIDKDKSPKWVNKYLKDCVENIPFYHGRKLDLTSQPCLHRDSIRQEPWNFVHQQANLDELLVYSTSGTTGAAMDVNFSPSTQASWIVQLEEILKCYDLSLDVDVQKVAVALICNQEETLTYASMSTYLNGAGILKVNLNVKDWNHPDDRVVYLEKYNPQILTGDPIAFMALLELQPKLTPKMMVSSAMRLMPELQKKLEIYFDCPVVDVYSMTECRMIAFRQGSQYRTIRPDLYLEVWNPESGEILPYGSFGELLITGGNNPFIGMIRYRTGDYGRLILKNGIQYIEDFEARELVVFYTRMNQKINPVDVSRAMMNYAIAAFHLHQNSDYSLEIKLTDIEITEAVENTIKAIFETDIQIQFKTFTASELKGKNKGTIYSSDIKYN